MGLLVLGGRRFVGCAVVQEAPDRGWDVTALHRGLRGALPAVVRVLHADRADVEQLTAALGEGSCDVVVGLPPALEHQLLSR